MPLEEAAPQRAPLVGRDLRELDLALALAALLTLLPVHQVQQLEVHQQLHDLR